MAELERGQGCLLGQLAGDALGSLVEFRRPEDISAEYPDGVRDLADGGAWNTIAGQPTDDSEMALLLARMLAERGAYDAEAAFAQYRYWLDTEPFDCGMTIGGALTGDPNPESQANGAMMRASPLGIFGAKHSLAEVAQWARQDAALTHPNPLCGDANALFAMALAQAIKAPTEPQALYEQIVGWARDLGVPPPLLEAIAQARDAPPADYVRQQGWVLIAFRNALWQLLHAPSAEAGIIDTVMQGGDTDTNAAICGALLGAVHGLPAIPTRWVDAILRCRPEAGRPGVHQPRPEIFWPTDALQLAAQLVA